VQEDRQVFLLAKLSHRDKGGDEARVLAARTTRGAAMSLSGTPRLLGRDKERSTWRSPEP